MNKVFGIFSKPRAFSLIELLVVVAIGAILLTLSVTAFQSIFRAGNVSSAAGKIAGILEKARTHAMANNTYVRVGLRQETPDVLAVGLVVSPSGVGNGTNNFVPLDRITRFENLRLVNAPASSDRPSGVQVLQLADEEDAEYAFEIGAGANPVEFDAHVIQWNPRGEAGVARLRMNKRIEIGLQSSANGQIVTPENYAAIQIGALSGSVTVFRP